MKRHLTLAVALAVVAAAFAPMAPAAAKKKKPKPKPVPVAVDAVYYIVWDGEGCVLSTSTTAANPDEGCADPFAGAAGPALGTGPFAMPAVDGLPLTLDASKAIAGKISVSSFYAVGVGPDVMGIGEAQVDVKLTATSAGQEIVLGELTTEPYLVTPASADYVVEFEIVPDAALAGVVLDGLTLSMEITGDQMFHGVFPADGTSTLTLGALALP